MKYITTVLFLLFSINHFAQKYHFDYVLQYNSENDGHRWMTEFAINSKNQNYMLSFSNKNGKVFAELHDYTSKSYHVFEVKDLKIPLKTESFKYVAEKYYSKISSNDTRVYKKEFIKENNDTFQYKIYEYDSPNSKFRSQSARATFAKFDVDLSSFGLRNIFEDSNIHNKISFGKNLILKEIEKTYRGGSVKMKLNYVEPQDFELEVPLK